MQRQSCWPVIHPRLACSSCGTRVSLPTCPCPRLLVQVRRSRFGVDGGALRGVLSGLASDWPSRDGSLKSCGSSCCPPVFHRLAMSCSLLLVLLLGSAVTSHIITSEDRQMAVKAGPEEGEDVSVLLQQLKVRVEQLEKESKARGQRRPAEQVQLHSAWLWF